MKHYITEFSSIFKIINHSAIMSEITNRQIPLEGVILVPVCDNKPVMAYCHRINKANNTEELLEEWAFVAGTTFVKGPNDTEFIDKNGKQISSEESKNATYKSLQYTIKFHLLNELTDLKKNPKSDEEIRELELMFEWLIKKVYESNDWEFVEFSRPSQGINFMSSVGICRISLTQKEIDDLNIQILKFQQREQRRFVPLNWKLIDSGKLEVDTNVPLPAFKYGIPIDLYIQRVRNYFANIMFPKFGKTFAKLIELK